MSKAKKYLVRIIKIIAVLVLIFSIISSAFFVIFKSSIDKANKNGTIPTIFGKEYITVSSDKFSDFVPKGSMVLLNDVDVSNLTGTEVLVYETGNTTVDNTVFGKYSLGVMMKSSTEDLGDNLFIQNVITQNSIEVPKTAIKAQATYQVSHIGSIISKASSNLGLLQFVIIPVALFIILLLIVLIIKILSGEEDDDVFIDDIKSVNNIKKRTIDIDDEEEYEDRLVRLKDRYIEQNEDDELIDKDESIDNSNEVLNLNFEKKQPEISSELIHSSDIINDDKIDEILSVNQEDEKVISQLNAVDDISQETIEDEEQKDTSDILSKIMDDNNLDSSESKSNYDDASAQVDEFLRSLNIDLDSVESEYMKHTTIEFDMDKMSDKLIEDDILSNTKSQQLLDNILIDLKDNALDVRFDSLKSDSVKIEESRKGDGFTIKTPNYKANIKIEIDKNEN